MRPRFKATVKAGGLSEAGHRILPREESSAARGENSSLTRERRTLQVAKQRSGAWGG
jgi:hypothetical protein